MPLEKPVQSPENKAMMFQQFEMILPRILEMMCEGYTLEKAVKDLPPGFEIRPGAFMHWLKKQPKLFELYREAEEIRTEYWAGQVIRHATAEDNEDGSQYMHDVARSRLIVDTYWKLMASHNRKRYGDSKQIEVNQTISINAALAAAQGRVEKVIEAEIIDDDVDSLPAHKLRQIEAPDEYEDDE